jgi:hypothetical protein
MAGHKRGHHHTDPSSPTLCVDVGESEWGPQYGWRQQRMKRMRKRQETSL